MALTKEAILAAADLPRERLDMPEWGGEVWVRGLTAAERDAFEAAILEDRGKGAGGVQNFRARLAVRCLVDEGGARLFADSEAEALGRKSGRALDRVFVAAQRASGFTDEDVKDLEKNSASEGPGGSPTA